MVQPTLKKTRSGYVVKHQCGCGTSLVNKMNEVDMQDHCPSCQRQFIVPGRDLVLKLKQELDAAREEAARDHTEKDQSVAVQESTKKRTRELEPPAVMPADGGPGYSVPSEIRQLRELSDATAKWIRVLHRLFWVFAWIGQAAVLVFLALALTLNNEGLNASFVAITFATTAMWSATVWLTYFLTKVQLGMVAAVVLIERNTRSSR